MKKGFINKGLTIEENYFPDMEDLKRVTAENLKVMVRDYSPKRHKKKMLFCPNCKIDVKPIQKLFAKICPTCRRVLEELENNDTTI